MVKSGTFCGLLYASLIGSIAGFNGYQHIPMLVARDHQIYRRVTAATLARVFASFNALGAPFRLADGLRINASQCR